MKNTFIRLDGQYPSWYSFGIIKDVLNYGSVIVI